MGPQNKKCLGIRDKQWQLRCILNQNQHADDSGFILTPQISIELLDKSQSPLSTIYRTQVILTLHGLTRTTCLDSCIYLYYCIQIISTGTLGFPTNAWKCPFPILPLSKSLSKPRDKSLCLGKFFHREIFNFAFLLVHPYPLSPILISINSKTFSGT